MNQFIANLSVWGFGLSVLSLLLGYAGSIWLPLDILSHLRGYFFGSLITFGTIFYATNGGAGLLAIGLFLTVLAHNLIGLTNQPSDVDFTGSRANRIKLVSLNTWYENLDLKRAQRFLRQADADVVLLYEFSQTTMALLADIKDIYPHQIHCDTGCGMALMSKLPWSDASTQPRGPNKARMIWATFENVEHKFNVVGVHLTKPIDSPWAQATEIDDVAKKVRSLSGPSVLAGDMNATPWSAIFRRISERTGLRKTDFTSPSWPAAFYLPPQLPIDHFLFQATSRLRT